MERRAEDSREQVGWMSIESFLEYEMAHEMRHEYVEGRVFAMSGPHSRHNRISVNIAFQLRQATRGKGCRTYVSEVKVRTPNDRVYYPDVMLVCTPRDDDGYIVDDPCIVVEVASPSTWRVDRFEKQPEYVQIPSLTSFLRVDQHGRQVDHWRRTDMGVWEHEVYLQGGTLQLPCAGASLSLDEIYEGIVMPAPPVRRVYEGEPEYGF